MRAKFWLLWSLTNLAWLVGLPLVYGLWLSHEVQYEYAAGIRVSTNGDSISIPIAGVAILNFSLVVAVNVCWGTYVLFRRRT